MARRDNHSGISGKIPKNPSSSKGKKIKKNKANSKQMKQNNSDSFSIRNKSVFANVKKSKKSKVKDKKKNKSVNNNDGNDNRLQRKNSFNALDEVPISDDEIINVSSASDDDNNDDKDVILIENSDVSDVNGNNDEDDGHDNRSTHESDDGVIKSNNDKERDEKLPQAKKQKIEKSNLDVDQDFIALDFSSEDASDYDSYQTGAEDIGYDDNEYLSNDEGSYHTTSTSHKAGQVNSDYPWIRNSDHTKQKEMSDWLTTEIKDFVKYISPSVDEIKARNQVVQNLRNHIKSMWPDAELHCFGSYATDLYLPGSDIDCVVISKSGKYDNKSSLYQLSSYLRSHKLGINIEPIAKAKVPIIKFVDPKSKIHIDISFEKSNGLTAAELIISWIKSTPGLREIALIVKQFLSVRRLNEVHTGGLGGFSIICLAYSFLKLHPRISTNNIDPLQNLGVLLIEFFELYGYNFGYDKVALAFTPNKDPIYVTKNSNINLLNRNPFALAIQDPHDPNNNISRGSFNLRDIKRAFGGAFELLANKCYDMQVATYKQRLGKSILGDIIKYRGKERDFEDARDQVKNLAYHVASGQGNLGYGLPLLPSQKAGINLDEYYMSDSNYSDSDNENSSIISTYEKSQENQRVKKTNKKPEELLGIQEDSESDEDLSDKKKIISNTKEPTYFTDSDSDYDPSKAIKPNSSAASVTKDQKRDYWSLKSGSTF